MRLGDSESGRSTLGRKACRLSRPYERSPGARNQGFAGAGPSRSRDVPARLHVSEDAVNRKAAGGATPTSFESPGVGSSQRPPPRSQPGLHPRSSWRKWEGAAMLPSTGEGFCRCSRASRSRPPPHHSSPNDSLRAAPSSPPSSRSAARFCHQRGLPGLPTHLPHPDRADPRLEPD
ncbi:hypothetical protein HJG60_009480 [Phyllostomus discolor]|uniref:Uncharacterized protein n=1 Tax=Phyllostomus discolor TaxID=89673 RepID=A0A834DDK8_9CHIR|nr:hypothetical protein HJG60_009480 [Phyllostomus discolor]